MDVTKADVEAHRKAGSWRVLERVALAIAADVRERTEAVFSPLLGGGTRLMLAFDHRISHDIDLFVGNPEWIGYLTPRLNDRAERLTTDYEEGPDYLKLTFPEGEVDFIVRGSLLNLPAESSAETEFLLEPIAEVLAKKLFYRGGLLTPRDLFDWWTIEMRSPGTVPEGAMGRLLQTRHEGIAEALRVLPRSAAAARLWDDICAPDKPALAEIAMWAQGALDGYASAAATRRDADPATRTSWEPR